MGNSACAVRVATANGMQSTIVSSLFDLMWRAVLLPSSRHAVIIVRRSVVWLALQRRAARCARSRLYEVPPAASGLVGLLPNLVQSSPRDLLLLHGEKASRLFPTLRLPLHVSLSGATLIDCAFERRPHVGSTRCHGQVLASPS